MIYTISNEDIFQVLSSSFSIGPSETGYELQVGADSRSFTTLFSVGANTPRMVTNVANGSYFRLKNNTGNVKVNWERVCSDDSGGGFDPSVLEPYWTSAQTQSAITIVEDHLFDVEEVTASALTELHEGLMEVSGRSVDLSGYYTSAQTEDAISAATAGKADAANVYIPRYARFPLWNTQGIITGTTGYDYFNKGNSINGITYTALQTNNYHYSIYAPTTPGTAGEILVSAGNGAPVWSAMTFPTPDVDKAYVDSAITGVQDQIDVIDEVIPAAIVDLNTRKVESTSVHTIWKGTQAEYDAIASKDPATLYIIL